MMEVSFEGISRLLGIDCRDVGTYVSSVYPDGSIHGEGNGVVMGPKGEVATWRAVGVGRPNPKGGADFRGALFYQTRSEQLLRLNGIAVVFEYSEDIDGKTSSQLYEWS